ncbi:hypothetical protein CLV58_102292 [Spirosoma oryzae]|uniref:Uncharacterized protein n=1 Tax=Spirosoma oryzae TaxID=1469603 RepID=A0A2T0TIP6_9BACT|nr:hypothetical protein CLV58_102292 [Spirosoma oryzae]
MALTMAKMIPPASTCARSHKVELITVVLVALGFNALPYFVFSKPC